MKNLQLKKCAQFSFKEIKKLTSKKNLEKDLKKYLKEKLGDENSFFKDNYIFVKDNIDALEKAIIDSISDEFTFLQDLKEAKKALNKIKKIADNYFNNYVSIHN
jgi:hypothetical protein